jgi:hypothetical protein
MIATRLRVSLAQVNLVAAHDRDGVDAADRAEPAAPVRAAHDGDHPAHRLLGPGLLGRVLPRFGRQVAGQAREVTAGLGHQGPAGPVLKLVQGQPADGRVITERPQRDVTLGVRDAEGFVRFAHHMPLAELACRAVRVRRGRGAAKAAAGVLTGRRSR